MSTFFCSDLHLGHVNMSIKREFNSIEEYHELIIKNWNEKISKKDTVYILGDITNERKHDYNILDALKGIKIVIPGNHDRRQDIQELSKHVHNVSGPILYKSNFWLTHIPIHPSCLGNKINIHGHIHDKLIYHVDNYIDKRYINVCMENINYIPKTLDELMKNYNKCLNCGKIKLIMLINLDDNNIFCNHQCSFNYYKTEKNNVLWV